MTSLIIICLEFMKTGLFAVGGGLATIPFIYEMSDNYGWFSHQDILDFLAISEATPGPMGVNMSTYAGYITYGIPGAILTTLSLVLPSVVVVLIVARLLERFKENRFVKTGFHILRPASTALIAAAGLNILLAEFFDVGKITFDVMGKVGEIFTHVNWIAIALFAVLFVLIRFFKKINPLIFILASACIGIVLKL